MKGSTPSCESWNRASRYQWVSLVDPSVLGTVLAGRPIVSRTYVSGLGPKTHGTRLVTDSPFPANEKNGPYNMHRQVFDWITTKYPHPDHKFTNGAVPATGM